MSTVFLIFLNYFFMKSNFSLEVSNTQYINKTKKSNTSGEKNMLIKIMDILAGLKMTIVSGIFLLCAIICMVSGIESPIDPAWGAVIISGIPLFYLALNRLIFEKWVSSALLITIAMVASLVIGEIFAAAEVAWIMALGALLEDWTVERAKKGLKNLIELTPQTGRLICNENGKKQEKIISVDEIKIDDVLRVLPGEKIPVDGIVIDGDSSIDQSVITGESLPVDKSDGDEVFCGTLNMYGVLDIKTTSLSENSSLQKLIDLVKQADEKQAPTQRIADKWATWLVPVALIIAAAAWVATGNIERGVTVLVVFCPCALILATPTAVMAAIGQATKHGILIKSGEALENLGELNTITFDKTGTLTYGDLKVSDIIPTGDFTENEVLAIASAVENLSEHPLAKAIADKANDENIAVEKVSNFKMYPGRGVFGINSKGKIYAGNLNYIKENFEISDKTNTYLDNLNSEGKAIIIVGLNNQVIGIIALSDVIREESQSVVENLHELGVKTVILTGDNDKTANYFAKQVGISEVHGNLLPNEKLQWVEKFKKSENKVCMVGDGVNDAPALKTANVSVAMGSIGSDIAIDAADIALLGDDIEKIPYLKRLSNSTLFTIKFNIALSMMINAIAIICSVLGLLNPVTGAIVHNAGSCLVVLNAALLYDRNFDKNRIHSHYHYHDDGKHAHSHENVEILGEIHMSEGVKHIHSHRHSLKFKSHCSKL
mgnify:CR=1 FL=1